MEGDGRHVGTPGGAVLLGAIAGIAFGTALGVAVWRMVSRARRAPRPGHPTRAFPLPPRFGLALPGIAAWVLVVTLAAALGHAGVEPGPVMGLVVASALAAPFAACGFLHHRRRREYCRALASGELDGWRGVALKLARSHRPGFWGTLVVTALASMFIVLPLVFVVVGSFGVESREVGQGLVALAVVLPVPVAVGVWLVPQARSEAERKREYEGPVPRDQG